MMDDRAMRAKIDSCLEAHAVRRTSKAARLAAAVGASGKLLTGCIVVEYGAPAYAAPEYAAPFDAAMDDASDAADIDAGSTVDYAAPFDASGEDLSVVRYGGPMDGG